MPMQNRVQIRHALVALLLTMAIVILGIAGAGRIAPAATENPRIDYAHDIRPIFQASCAKCHLNGIRKGGMDLGSLQSLLKGGESEEPAIVPHDSANSRLMKLVTSDDADVRMPQKGQP